MSLTKSPAIKPLGGSLGFDKATRRCPEALPCMPSRRAIQGAERIVIKAGTSVVSDENGYPSLSRLGAVVEQCAWLRHLGKEVLLVSSGAVGIGREMMRKQAVLRSSLGSMLGSMHSSEGDFSLLMQGDKKKNYDSACAAAGQLGLMSLYETLFNQRDVATSQLLVTEFDFRTPERRRHVRYTISTMLKMGIVPILNENDAVSGNEGYTKDGSFSDNDGLAALVAEQMGAELLILLTDVSGVYDKAPSLPDARVLHTYYPAEGVEFGEKSSQGRGGMQAKINAALKAVKGGVQNVVIAFGHDPFAIERVCCGEQFGTLFCADPENLPLDADDSCASSIVEQAQKARDGMRQLCALTTEERTTVMRSVASALLANEEDILAANERDLIKAEQTNLAGPLLKRLSLTPEKLRTLADGISSLADMKEPIGKCISNLEVASGLKLKQVTAPIGVVLVVFESRPDSLPQIASLALRSGNGLLLKGGKEAEHSNACLHRVIVNAVHTASGGKVPREVIGLVMGRAAVGELLKLDELIDLVIPRGSNSLVMNIKANTRIPVLGHAEGICHVYVDSEADSEKAADIVVDSKTNYPAACNAAETLLLHESLLADPAGCASYLLRRLQTASVTVMGGPRAVEVGFIPAAAAADGFKNEYGDNTITVELVPSLEAAIEHIHNYGSGHTETIVTENAASAQRFLEAVDSACVFHNSSTRFSDGFRFGLGAEVGISTGRIHARGPVGVEGLLTTKWVLRSDTCHVVGKMNGNEMPYTHVPIELEDGI